MLICDQALPLAPAPVPITAPLAAPMAAPGPRPIAAPRAAPSSVPTTALPTTFALACSGPPATWLLAKFRQITSSSWNAENGFPGAGITCTVGPGGVVAHALRATGITTNATLTFIAPSHSSHSHTPNIGRGRFGE